LRIAKHTLLMMVSLMLIAIGCGKNEGEVKSATESMKKNKKVVIITDAVNPPFEYGSGSGVQGLGADLGTEIGKTLNIEVKWITLHSVEASQPNVKVRGYEHLFDILKKGDAEMIVSSIAVDPKRETEFAFSKPYYETGDVIAHQRSDFSIKGLANLAGKKVGVCSGRPGDAFMAAQKVASNVTVTRYPTLDDALGALNRSELEAVVGDEPILGYSIFNSFQSTTLLQNQVDKIQYAVAVRKGETELLAKINETIDRMKSSGELQKSVDQWVGNIVQKAIERGKGDLDIENKKKAAKAIGVNITKTSGNWKMDRLDGFVLVMEGPTGRYESTPILTEGNKGNCKFKAPVPPGEYSLNFSILGMKAKVPVPDLPKMSLVMDMSIGNGITIICK